MPAPTVLLELSVFALRSGTCDACGGKDRPLVGASSSSRRASVCICDYCIAAMSHHAKSVLRWDLDSLQMTELPTFPPKAAT